MNDIEALKAELRGYANRYSVNHHKGGIIKRWADATNALLDALEEGPVQTAEYAPVFQGGMIWDGHESFDRAVVERNLPASMKIAKRYVTEWEIDE
jgi:hypothetical protein